MTDTQSRPQAWEPSTAASSVFHTPDSADGAKLLDLAPPAQNKPIAPTTEAKPSISPRPVTPGQQKADESSGSTVGQQSPKSIASTVQRPTARTRARSNSSKLIHRLTSRGSIHSISQKDNPATPGGAPGSPGSDASSMDLPGKIDKEALSRAKGKYKSGVHLDKGLMLNLAADEDTFMQSSTAEEPAPEPISAIDAARNELLASGGTAAAKAYYQGQGNGYGSSIFPEQQIAAAEASRAAAIIAQQQELLRRQVQQPRSPPSAAAKNPNLLAANGHRRKSGSAQRGSTSSTSVLSSGSSLSPHAERSSLGATLDNKSRDPSPASKTANGAKLSAAEATTDKPPSSDGGHSNEHSQSVDKSPAASIKSKRRTFLGLSSKSTDKVNKIPGGKKSRRASTVSVNTDTHDGETADGSVRQRRYPNTREMDILAAQLAREAALEQHMPQFSQESRQWGSTSPSGSRTPADKRAPGIPSAWSPPGAVSSTQSLSSMPNGFQPFAPPFARESRNDSPASSAGPSSPRFSSMAELPGPAHFVRAGLPKSPSASPSVTQKANISGMPGDMLTGLGHGPYPFVAQDPLLASGDANGGSVSGDATPIHGRRASAPGSKKTSVLSMSMHDPESEMQGLTKMPKSGKGTPWGSRVQSRAPSRAVSPRTSNTNLRDAAASPKQQQGQQSLNQLPTSGTSHINLAGLTGLRRRSQGSGSEERGKSSVDGSVMSSGATGVVVPTPVAEHPASAVQTPAVEGERSVDVPTTASSGVQTGSTTPRAAPSGRLPPPSPQPVSAPSQATLSPGQGTPQQNGTVGSQEKRKARLSFFSAFGKSRENVSLSKQEKKEQNKRRSLPSSPVQQMKGLPAQRGVRHSAEHASAGQSLARTKSPARPPRSASRPAAAGAPTSNGAAKGGVDASSSPSSPPPAKRPGFKRFLSKFGSGNNVHSPKKSPPTAPAPPLPASAATLKSRGGTVVAPSTPPRLRPSRADQSDLSSSSRDSRGQQSSSTSISTQATTPSVSGASTGGDGIATDWVLTPEDVDADKQYGGQGGVKGDTSVTVMGPAIAVAGR